MIKMTWPRQRWALPLLLLITALLAVIVFRKRSAQPLQAIPGQSAFVVEFNGLARAGQLVAKMPATEWKAVLQNTFLRPCWQDVAVAERLFRHDDAIHKAFAEHTLAAAITLNEADSLHPLFALDLGARPDLESVLKNNPLSQKYFPSYFHGSTLFTVHFSKRERLVVARIDNLLLFSRFSYLVEDALAQLEKGDNWWADRSWRGQLDDHAPFKLYCRPLAAPMAALLTENWRFLPDLLDRNIAWMGFSWDGEHLRGAAKADGFLQKLLLQGEPPHDELYAVLPDNTAFLAAAGLGRRTALSDLAEGDYADFQKYILPWAGHDVALVMTQPLSAELREEQFVVLAMNDSVAARQRLEAYGSQRGLLKQYDYQTFQIRQFLSNSLLSTLLTRQDHSVFQNPACTIIGNYVVFAASNAALELWIDKYIVNETLLNTPEFLLQRKKLAQQGNAVLMLNAGYLPALLKKMVMPRLNDRNEEEIQLLAQTGLVGIELWPGKYTGWIDLISSSQVLSSGPKTTAGGTSILWKTPLSDEAATPPSVVMRTREGEAVVLIQDKRHELYCLRANGSMAWRRQFDKPLLSAVQGIDFQNNGTTYFLFNTASHIWLLDEAGHDVNGFPLKLQSAATNGLTVVDFDENRRYNFFVACANGNIYGYDQYGRPLPGWNPQGGVGQVLQPVLHFLKDDKDYLVALSKTGRLSVFGRDGSSRFGANQLDGKFYGPPQADPVSKSPRITCANTLGKVFICTLDGGTFSLSLAPAADARARAYFVFAPLEGDKRYDYAVMRGSGLNLAGYAGNTIQTIAKRQFESAPDTLFAASGGARLGAVDRAKKQIFLLDNRGKSHPDFPLAGDTPFVLSPLFEGKPEQILVVGNGASVYAYKIR